MTNFPKVLFWGNVEPYWSILASTTQKNPFRQEQQGLSDQFGITTYNVDGSVSTKPNNPNTLHTVAKKPWPYTP